MLGERLDLGDGVADAAAISPVGKASHPLLRELALDDSPAVRDAEVARTAKLVPSVQYPPTELIQRISRLLANNWNHLGE